LMPLGFASLYPTYTSTLFNSIDKPLHEPT
jgi:hypothetical protein